MRLAFLPPLTVIALTLACPATPAAAAGTGTPDAGKATTATTTPDAGKPETPPAPPPEPPQPEPAGIKASSKKPPAEPKGKGVWPLYPKSTEVSFTTLSH